MYAQQLIDRLREDESLCEVFEAVGVLVSVEDGRMAFLFKQDDEGQVADAVMRYDAANDSDIVEYLSFGGGDGIDGIGAENFGTAEFGQIKLLKNYEGFENGTELTEVQPAIPIPDTNRECRCENCCRT